MPGQEDQQLRAAALQNAQAIFLARKRAEEDLVSTREALRQSEAQLRSITDAMPALIGYVDPDFRYRFLNQQYAVWFGRPQEELLGLHMRDVLGAAAFAVLEPHVVRAMRGEQAEFEGEVPYSGGKRFVRAVYLPDRAPDGPVHGVHLMVIDISERKQAEDALRQTEGRLFMAMEAGQMGAWEWIVATGKVTWSPTLERIHGLEPGTFGGRLEDFQRDIHPDDHPRVLAAIQRSLETGHDYQMEYRIIKPDGALAWIEIRWKLLRDAAGQPERMAGLCMDISERKKLEEVHARLAAVVEFSEDAIVSKSLDGIIATWNKGAERMFGYSAAEMVGKPVTVLIPAEQADEEPKILARLKRGEIIDTYESVRQRKDGTLLDVSLTISPIKDGMGNIIGASKIARDITQRRRAEEEREHLLARERRARAEAEEAENRARFLAEASASLVSTLDYEATLRNVAKAAVPGVADWCVVHMLEPEGAIRVVATAHIDPAKQALAKKLQERYPEDPASPFGVPAVLRSGRSLLYADIADDLLVATARDEEHLAMTRSLGLKSAMIVPLVANGQALGTITFVAAESGRHFSESSLPFAEDLAARASAAAENARLYREVRNANAAKDHFLAVLSHELRTPLNPVLMTITDLERDESLPAPLREQMTIVRRNVELEARLIDDLLDSTRIANGKLQLQRSVVDARELLHRAIAIVESDARAKGVLLEVSPCDAPCPVYGDPARLQQVFWNVVKNAVKFTSHAGSVRVACEIIEDQAIRVTVDDDGIGFAPEDAAKIFNAFEQGDTGNSHRFGGLGLGLAISKALVALHEGTLTASSEGRGSGALFTVELPLTRETRTSAPESCTPAMPHRPLRLLVVEDHEATSEVMARLLKKRGYTVAMASSVNSALSVLASTPIDVLISDLGLPDGTGAELMTRIKATRALPGIALSGYGTDRDINNSRAAGFRAHLTKPVDIERLDREIQSLSLDTHG